MSANPTPLCLLWGRYLTWQESGRDITVHQLSSSSSCSSQLTHLQTSAGTGAGAGRAVVPDLNQTMWMIALAALLHCASAFDVDLKKLDGLAKARVEVKAFVVQDIPLYHNLVMKHIPGADPELVLLNHYYEELDRIALSDMTRSEINELLGKLGFYKKAQPEDEVPEEFRFSPAKDSPFKHESEHKPYTSSLPTEKASSEPNAEVEHTDL